MSTIGWPQPEAASIALPSAPPEAAMGHLESSAIEHELASEHLPLDELYAKRQIDRRGMLLLACRRRGYRWRRSRWWPGRMDSSEATHQTNCFLRSDTW